VPWQEFHKMGERLRFVTRLLDGETMSELCREFDISRKTGLQDLPALQGCGAGAPDRPKRNPEPSPSLRDRQP
jgi:hypothetical protein